MPFELLDFREKVSKAYLASQDIQQSPISKRFAKTPSFDEFIDTEDTSVYQPSADTNAILVYDDP